MDKPETVNLPVLLVIDTLYKLPAIVTLTTSLTGYNEELVEFTIISNTASSPTVIFELTGTAEIFAISTLFTVRI